MELTYLFKWLAAFYSSVVLQAALLFWWATRQLPQKDWLLAGAKLGGLSFLQNLPGLFLILTLMAREGYVALYCCLALVSLPLTLSLKLGKFKAYSLYPEFITEHTIPVTYLQIAVIALSLIYMASIFFVLKETLLGVLTVMISGSALIQKATEAKQT